MKQKKIGILTFHRTTNFGSLLQTYGLYKKIVDLGYECEIIDYRCPAIEQREQMQIKLNFFNLKIILKYIIFQKKILEKGRKIEEFLINNSKLSRVYYPENISESEDNYEKIIVGSDIVWGRDITNHDYNYFLNFIKNKEKKYAFASSVGDYTVKEDDKKIAKLLSEFQKIYLREDQAVQWVKEISNMKADVVCDPTMLLSKNEWIEIIKPIKKLKNYILVYFDSDNGKCLEDAIKYAKNKNLKVAYINYGLPKKGVINIKPTTLEEFLGYILYAEFIFTASYHGILFSLYFKKELIFYTRAHKTRVLSLAKRLGIMEKCGDSWNLMNYNKINYEIVDKKIEEFRRKSIEALKGILEL